MTNKIIISLFALVFAALSLSNVTKADDHAKGKWFLEGRYQKSFSEGAKLSDAGTSNLRVVSSVGTKWKSLDSFGGAIGYQYSNGATAFTLGYDNFGTSTYQAASFTNGAGTTLSNVAVPVKTTNIMLEMTHKIPLTDNFFGIGVFGIGQASHKTSPFSATGLASSGVGQSASMMSTRFGLGLGYKLSNNVELIAAVQRSDYGDAEIKASASTAVPAKMEVSANEASIRLRFMF